MWKLLALLLIVATPAAAGPWPRGTGRHFLSFATEYDVGTGRPGANIYHEWGIGARTTLVLSASRSQGGAARAMVSLGRDLWPGEDRLRGWRLGWALGAGLHDGEAAARIALSAGRSIRVFGFPGWISGEAQAIATTRRIEGRAEGTLGVTTPRGVKIWSQLSLTGGLELPAPVTIALPPGPAFGPPPVVTATWLPPEIRASLSAAVPIRRRTWLTAGASKGFEQGGTLRLSLGLWTEF